MDSGVVRSSVHDERGQDHPHNVGLQHVVQGGDEHQHDKKSVLNKVKAKAKKIKDTITKHGHGHGHDHDHDHEYRYEDQHVPDDHDLYEEDDEDEEMVEDPEVNGAPIYESAAVRSAIQPGQVENLGHSRGNFAGTTVTGEEHHHEPRIVVVSSSAESNLNRGTEPARTFVGEDKTRQHDVNLDGQIGLDEDHHAPGSRAEAYNPSNYQSKVTDPTGAGTREIDTTPIEDSLARMNVHNEPKPNTVLPIGSGTQYPSAGSHEQFSLESTPNSTNSTIFPEHTQGTTKTFDTMTKPEEHPHYETTEKPSTLSSYTGKVSSATSAIADKAISAKNVVASKLGYGEKSDRDENKMKHEEHKIGEEKPSNQGSYTEKISSATSAIADKAISAKNVVTSKLGYGEKGDRDNKENEMKHEEHKIGEDKPSQQSSYTENISSATSAIADKAISAKNVVTSKLGYGEKGDRDNKETTHVEHESGDAATKPESTLEYGKKIASTVTEKLAPVYGAVAGVGSAVMSKVPGTGTGTSASTGSGNETENVVPKQDKGVSVKDYLAEKLRPGEEDRALSEVISDAYHKRKEDPTEGPSYEDRPLKEVVKDAIHKREEAPEKAEQKRPLGKVTESVEVKRYLGTDKDEKGSEQSHVNSPGKGVVDKLKVAVGSWFGTGETPSSQEVSHGGEKTESSN